MATERIIENGKLIALGCPVCGKMRNPKAFRGAKDNGGWFTKCSSCREAMDKLHDCDRCGGSGRYMAYNPTSGTYVDRGACYRCKGKGYLTQSDLNRNGCYDSHSAGRAMRGDMIDHDPDATTHSGQEEVKEITHEVKDDPTEALAELESEIADYLGDI